MRQDLKGLGTYGTVGLEFGLSVLVGLFGGQWIDKKLGTAPWFTLIGAAFGTAAGIRSLWRASKAAQRELEEEDRREREARREYHAKSGSDRSRLDRSAESPTEGSGKSAESRHHERSE